MGYRIPERYRLTKKSWGEDWGEDSYARISWDDTQAHIGGSSYWLLVEPPRTARASPSAATPPTATATATVAA